MAESNYGWMRAAGQAASIPLLIGIATGIGLLAGRWLDGKLGTAPWLTVILTFVGLAAGLYESVMILIKVTRNEDG